MLSPAAIIVGAALIGLGIGWVLAWLTDEEGTDWPD